MKIFILLLSLSFLVNCGSITEKNYLCRWVDFSVRQNTQSSNIIPVVTSNGKLGFGATTSGSPMAPITTWECDGFGNIVSDSQDIFRFAKSEVCLKIWTKSGWGSDIKAIATKEECK